MKRQPFFEFTRGIDGQGLLWTTCLVLFAILDVRTFVQGGAGLPAFFHASSLHWNWFAGLVEFWHMVLLLSFLVSAASLLARFRLAVGLGVGQLPWRFLCSYWSLEGLWPGNAEANLLISFATEVVRIVVTIYGIRYFKRTHGIDEHSRPARRGLLALSVVAALILMIDQIDPHGIVRWRLDDGSLMWVTPIDEQSFWIGRSCGAGTTLMRSYGSGKATDAECRHDAAGNYWILVRTGEELAKYPSFFNTRTQQYGPRERWEGEPPEGDIVHPARSAFLPL